MAYLFIPLQKADAAQRLVYGSIDETPDRAKEIMDYASAKTAFQEWSDTMAKASDGKSLGNVREQHNLTKACGKLVDITFDDTNKRISFCAKIVDDAAWEKVDQGVYTGFSPGGRYAKRWIDNAVAGHHRYTPSVGELSIVDIPCIPTGGFTMVKADGSEAEVSFVLAKAYEPGNEATRARADELAKAAGKVGRANDFVAKARSDLIAENAEAELAKVAEPAGEPAPTVISALQAAMAKVDIMAKGAAVFADPANKLYPLGTPLDIRAAWALLHLSKAATAQPPEALALMKSDTVAAWQRDIDPVGPSVASPAAFALLASAAPDVLAKAGAFIVKRSEEVLLAKGMYTVSRLADWIDTGACIQRSLTWEAESEGDESPLPAEMAQTIAAACTVAVHAMLEETSEIVQAYKDCGLDIDFDPMAGTGVEIDIGVMQMAAGIFDLAKADEQMLAKAGKRNSKGDVARIQSIHDKASELGADCASDKMAKMVIENGELQKAVGDAVPRLESLMLKVTDVTAERDAATEELAKANAELVTLRAEPAPSKARSAITLSKTDDAGAGTLGNGPGEGGEKPSLANEDLAKVAALPANERSAALESVARSMLIERTAEPSARRRRA